ncbi:DEAD/DEAH box helicase [uncultured Desulfosarcina sp.]|uniref:DEAD/DEAH box helicase n=1 Tax=uncultured Desulfosarcina sp. TaxID=218289 RepID=UPI0029C7E0A1|nr:DEAD/DEAH box helicase [uncultured Desulfosarcina sp.]
MSTVDPNAAKDGLEITIDRFLRLNHTPETLLTALVERFQMVNPKWLENHRMGRWNRGTKKVLRFYHRFGKDGIRIPRGYARQLLLTLKRDNLGYRLNDRRRLLPEVDFHFSGTLKSFQTTAVAQMNKKDFGTLSAPTGSGKTVMGLALVASRRQPAVIVVHTKDLAFQWIERIEQFLGIPSDEVGLIGAGKKRIGDRITVALVQTLYRCTEEIAPKTGHLVVDECHRTPSRTFTEAVTAFDSHYMLGLSATPWRRDKLSKLIFWHLGDVHHEVDKQVLEARGDILKADVIVRITSFTPYFDPVNDYSRMLSELTSDDDRNRLIAGDVAKEVESGKGVCLVLSDRKKHCETLQGILRFKFGIHAEMLTGDVKDEERRQVLDRLQRGKVRALIATGQLIGEGFDCPDLATLFMATPIRFSGRVMQYLGRILRPAEGKAHARVYDYVDERVPPLVSAARARQRVYGSGAGELL